MNSKTSKASTSNVAKQKITRPETPTPQDSKQETPKLEVRDLNVQVGKKTLLELPSWKIETGTFTAITGPNGAGKSTLLKSILGSISHKGSIFLDGEDRDALNPLERAQRLAYVPQQSLLRARLKGREVVQMGRYAHRYSGQGIGETAVLEAMENTDTLSLTERPFAVCSGGERARLLLARALATEATLLLLDEPVASLDLSHTLDFYERCQDLAKRGYTVVMVSHDLSNVMQYTDQTLLLHQGQIVQFGQTSEVLNQEHLRDIFGVECLNHGPRFHRVSKA